MKDDTADKILAWVVVGDGSVGKDGEAIDILQRVDIDTMKVIDTIVNASIPGSAEIRNISFGKKVNDVGGGVNDWCADDTNCIGNIGTTDFGLQEWRMNLSSIDEIAGLCVERPNPILGRGKEK